MVAAEAVERGRTSTADVLAFAAMDGAEHGGDESVMRVLSRFAMDGKFVGDLSLSEQELLEAAVAAQEQERSTPVASPLVVYESVEVVFRGCRGARAVGERGATAAGPGDS